MTRPGRKWRRTTGRDESVEHHEDALRKYIPVKTDDGIRYVPLEEDGGASPHVRKRAKELPRVNNLAPDFAPHLGGVEPLYRNEDGSPVRVPRQFRQERERARFDRNYFNLRWAWYYDQGWVWQAIFAFALMVVIGTILFMTWRWTHILLIAAFAGAVLWVKRRGGI